MNKFLKWLAIGAFLFIVLVTVLIIIANNTYDPEYEVIEETDREDSFEVRVTTDKDSSNHIEAIVEDIEEEYENVDAVWLWIYDTDDELIAKAKIPYNEKGEIMIGEDKTVIEMKD